MERLCANDPEQMILSERSGQIRTLELKEAREALRNDWTIETYQGGRRTAIPRMDHMTGAAKIQNKWYEVIGVA